MTASPGSPKKPPFSDRFIRWVKRELFAVSLMTLLVAIGLALIWSYIAITVPPGSVGVFFDRLFKGVRTDRVYNEGLHLFFPWNKMYVYDCRLQQETYNTEILAFGGMTVKIDVAVRWRVIPNYAPSLHLNLGPEYKDSLIRPAVFSAVRNVVGRMNHERLYSIAPGELQTQVLEKIRETILVGLEAGRDVEKKLGGAGSTGWRTTSIVGVNQDVAPVLINDAVVLRVTLPDIINQSIDEKFAAGQRVIEQRYKVMESIERYKSRYVDAAAQRRAQELINPGLTENFLRLEGVRATQEIAKSNNAKLVVMGGGKDGLPVILNPGPMDSPFTSDFSTPLGSKGPEAKPPEAPKLDEEFKWETLERDIKKLEEGMKELSDIDMPQAVFRNPMTTRPLDASTNWGLNELGERFFWPFRPNNGDGQQDGGDSQ